MSLKVIELFAGVGGFRVGLNHIDSFNQETGLANENGDWNFVWANQWEPSTKVQHAFNCYQTRFGKSEFHVNQDITSVHKKKDIPNHDLLVGGFPCQDYSVARSLSNEAGISGKKGVLWWEIHETIESHNTPFILLENVDRLLKSPASNRGRDFSIMLKTLDMLGYIVEWRVVNAAEYGMPQRRRRVFIFAYKAKSKYGKKIKAAVTKDLHQTLESSLLFNKEFPIVLDSKISQKDLNLFKDAVDVTDNYETSEKKYENTGVMIDGIAYHAPYKEVTEEMYTLGEIVEEASRLTVDYASYTIKDVTKWEYLKDKKSIDRVSKLGHEYKYSEGKMAFPDRLDVPGRTMLTSESTVNRSSHILQGDDGVYRTITEIEAELLNMFPGNWTHTGMHKRARFFMMGNALVTGIISRVENDLKEIVRNA